MIRRISGDRGSLSGEKLRRRSSPCRYSNDAQRQATKDAQDRRRCQENHQRADGLCPGIRIDKNDKEQTVLVYDFGGGTFDVSICRLRTGPSKSFDGNNRLGGDDFDKVIMDYMVAEFKEGIDLQGQMAMQRPGCRGKAKKELSNHQDRNQSSLHFRRAQRPRDDMLTGKI